MSAEPVPHTIDAREGGVRRRRAWLAAALAVGVLAASACGSSQPEQASEPQTVGGLDAPPSAEADVGDPVDGGLLVYGLNAETSSLHPYVGQWNSSAYTMANTIYDPLAAVGEDGIVRPYLSLIHI